MDRERKKTIVNLIVTIVLFIIGCFVGKMAIENISDTWLMFNVPAIGIIVIGELIWWRLSKRIFKD